MQDLRSKSYLEKPLDVVKHKYMPRCKFVGFCTSGDACPFLHGVKREVKSGGRSVTIFEWPPPQSREDEKEQTIRSEMRARQEPPDVAVDRQQSGHAVQRLEGDAVEGGVEYEMEDDDGGEHSSQICHQENLRWQEEGDWTGNEDDAYAQHEDEYDAGRARGVAKLEPLP